VPAAAADRLVGQVIDGRYQVHSRLARGGMATVYEATDLRLDRVVALKVMHQHLAEDPEFVSRFQREARAAARLSHPCVVGVFDQGRTGNLIYLAMELVPGRTLRDILHEFGPLAPEQALVILEPVLEGLAAAHQAGFVHRDIKPENVLISDDGRVKVADFGLARALSTTRSKATQGMIIGTVAYLSPEQVERGDADGRSDVYAAGILLFEMVTGEVPHAGESPLAVAYQHVHADVPAPSAVGRGIPNEIDALVVRATRRDPALRYRSALDFLADVRRIRNVLPPPRPLGTAPADRETLVVDPATAARLQAASAKARPKAAPRAAIPSGPAAPVTASPRRRNRGAIATMVIAIFVVAAGLGGWYLATGFGKTVPTPDLIAMSQSEAEQVLGKAGLTLEVREEAFSEDVPAGRILGSDPAPGDGVREQGTVGVTLSRGPERYPVPDVTGLSPAEATEAITQANLTPGASVQVFDDQITAGEVVGTDPRIGTDLRPGASVGLLISKGPKPVRVPDLKGRKANAAKRALTGDGLTPVVTEKFSESVPDGVVIGVKPEPGTVLDSGSEVELVISKGPPPVTVPDLVDMTRGQAVKELKRLGLEPKVATRGDAVLGRVYQQEPAAGTQLPRGSRVTLTII
jgi:beta-lactam-binding protein with PASTA domain